MARKRSPEPPLRRDDRAALFAAVRESPDDDAPRLVLADWLEEHGDEDDRVHAELIRVQCEQIRRTAALIDPDRPELIQKLLCSAEYRVSLLPYQFKGITQKDERLLELKSRDKELDERFGGRKMNALPSEHLCNWHRGFAWLNLGYLPFPNREAAAFAATPAADRVDGLTLNVTPSGSARLARSPLLAKASAVEVRGKHLDTAGLTNLLASTQLAGLRRFLLSTRFHAGVNVKAILDSLICNQLTHLCLGGAGRSELLVPAVAATTFPSLRALDLGGSHHLGAAGAEALASAGFLAHLDELELPSCELGDAGLRALVSSPHFRCPALLDCRINGLGPAGLRALLAAPGLENLVVLELNQNALGDAGIAELAASPRLAGLVRLGICQTAIGVDGIKALAESPHLSRLASLAVDSTIGEAGVRALLRSPHLKRLTLSIEEKEELSEKTLSALGERFHLDE